MGLRYNSINLSGAKCRWGSCQQGGKLRFNWRLIMAPKDVVDYVVVHELAHLKEREHDKAFYQLCRHMEPEYHQFEFDLRAYLTLLEVSDRPLWSPLPEER